MFNVFVAIDSETDHFPIGEYRKNWDTEVLKKIDIKIKEYEEDTKDQVKNACINLIKQLSKKQF